MQKVFLTASGWKTFHSNQRLRSQDAKVESKVIIFLEKTICDSYVDKEIKDVSL